MSPSLIGQGVTITRNDGATRAGVVVDVSPRGARLLVKVLGRTSSTIKVTPMRFLFRTDKQAYFNKHVGTITGVTAMKTLSDAEFLKLASTVKTIRPTVTARGLVVAYQLETGDLPLERSIREQCERLLKVVPDTSATFYL